MVSNHKIITWNVNGIRSVYLKKFVEQVRCLKPQIIAVQEVKCNDLKVIADIFEELGYSFQVKVAEKKGYSGVLIAFEKNLSDRVSFLSSYELNKSSKLDELFENEGRYLIAKIDNYFLLNVYIPSGSASEIRQVVKYRLMDNFLNWLGTLDKEILNNLIICGDMNICHQEIDIHHPQAATQKGLSGFLPDERAWFSKLLRQNLVDAFRHFYPDLQQYTWWSYRAGSRGKNLGWRLDYFLCGSEVLKSITDVKQHTHILGSDHCPVELEIIGV